MVLLKTGSRCITSTRYITTHEVAATRMLLKILQWKICDRKTSKTVYHPITASSLVTLMQCCTTKTKKWQSMIFVLKYLGSYKTPLEDIDNRLITKVALFAKIPAK